MKVFLGNESSIYKLEDMTDDEFFHFLQNHPDPELMGGILLDKIRSGAKKIKEKVQKALKKLAGKKEIPAWAKVVTGTVSAMPATVTKVLPIISPVADKAFKAMEERQQQVIQNIKPVQKKLVQIDKPSESSIKIVEPVIDSSESLEEKKSIPGWVWIGLATLPFLL